MLLHHTLLPERIPPSIPREGSASGSRPVSPEYPARVVRQWIPPSIPPEESASGSCSVSRQRSPPVAVSRQRSPPVDSGSGSRPVSRQWIPPRRIPPECAGGSRPVSRQSGPPVDPAQYPARVVREVVRQWIPPSIPPEESASGSRPVSRQRIPPVDPAQYFAEGRTELSGCPPAARPNPSQTQPEQLPPCDPKGLRFQVALAEEKVDPFFGRSSCRCGGWGWFEAM